VWKYATVFLSAVWCTRSRRVSDAKRSELLAQNLQRDLKDATAAFVPRHQDFPSFLAEGTGRRAIFKVLSACPFCQTQTGQADWPFSLSCHVLVRPPYITIVTNGYEYGVQSKRPQTKCPHSRCCINIATEVKALVKDTASKEIFTSAAEIV